MARNSFRKAWRRTLETPATGLVAMGLMLKLSRDAQVLRECYEGTRTTTKKAVKMTNATSTRNTMTTVMMKNGKDENVQMIAIFILQGNKADA